MDCQNVAERLPWLLAGSLPPEEDRQARAHLASCASCAKELEDVRLAAQAFGAHLSADSLVELAWDRPLSRIDADLAQRHLESCASCAEELVLIRESRRLEAQARPRATRAPVVWRWGALAASLPLAFVAGVLWRAAGGSGDVTFNGADRERLETQIADLRAEARRAQENSQALKQQIDRLAGPQPNVQVVEIFPDSLALRSARSSQNLVVVEADSAWVVLLLGAENAPAGPAAVEVRNQAGEVVWRGSGLKPGPLGGYTLGVPSVLLPDGRYTIATSRQEQTLDRYALEVRRKQ